MNVMNNIDNGYCHTTIANLEQVTSGKYELWIVWGKLSLLYNKINVMWFCLEFTEQNHALVALVKLQK